MSLVSVCVPIYNGEKYLRESLDSIVNQTYKNLEIVAVDDCSTDSGISIVEEYRSKDNRIRIVHNEQNLGLVGNWNRCISEAKGEYIKLHFQDDMMLLDTIEKMIGMAKKENVKVVLTDREYIFEDKVNSFYIEKLARLSDYFDENTVIQRKFIAKVIKNIGIYMNFIGEPILGLVRKDVFDEIGIYDDSLKQICDFEFWLRIGLNMKMGFIPERLHQFRLHNESQGAKNARHEGINPSHLDRINLLGKLNQHYSFEYFRGIIGKEFIENLLKKYINEYTQRYGKKMLEEYIDQTYFQYLDIEESSGKFKLSWFRKKK